jgi:uncharacterized protein
MTQTVLRALAALAAGVIFGAGLALSGMMDPSKVVGFLDMASGHWDPSLALVLGGAVLVAAAGVFAVSKMGKPMLDHMFHLPESVAIDRKLIGGSVLFGLGWGISGYCPGPALASLSLGTGSVSLFVGFMLAGMVLHDRYVERVT